MANASKIQGAEARGIFIFKCQNIISMKNFIMDNIIKKEVDVSSMKKMEKCICMHTETAGT